MRSEHPNVPPEPMLPPAALTVTAPIAEPAVSIAAAVSTAAVFFNCFFISLFSFAIIIRDLGEETEVSSPVVPKSVCAALIAYRSLPMF